MAACRPPIEACSRLAARALVGSGLAAAAAQEAAGRVVVLLAEWQCVIAPASEGTLDKALAEAEAGIAAAGVEVGK